MQADEKTKLLDSLSTGREALGKVLANVDEAVASRTPESGWSILQCMEHIVKSERYLLSRLWMATPLDSPRDDRTREAKIVAVASDRTHHIQAPEIAHPTGCFSTLGEALAAFDATRVEVISWIQDCKDDPRCLVTDHPLIPGPVTCYETLLMIAAHPGRHAKQIEEIRRAIPN
jgi:hypothetical protein